MPPVVSRGERGDSSPASPHLVVRLGEGWRYLPERRAFEKDDGSLFSRKGRLPPRTRIRLMVPGLADSDRPLSSDERELARTLQVVLPGGHDVERHLVRIRTWPCVEKAWVSPDVGLPSI